MSSKIVIVWQPGQSWVMAKLNPERVQLPAQSFAENSTLQKSTNSLESVEEYVTESKDAYLLRNRSGATASRYFVSPSCRNSTGKSYPSQAVG
jgi:hypothetical protein